LSLCRFVALSLCRFACNNCCKFIFNVKRKSKIIFAAALIYFLKKYSKNILTMVTFLPRLRVEGGSNGTSTQNYCKIFIPFYCFKLFLFP
jgi:hypothetical protein